MFRFGTEWGAFAGIMVYKLTTSGTGASMAGATAAVHTHCDHRLFGCARAGARPHLHVPPVGSRYGHRKSDQRKGRIFDRRMIVEDVRFKEIITVSDLQLYIARKST
jgi:hypothetical protein